MTAILTIGLQQSSFPLPADELEERGYRLAALGVLDSALETALSLKPALILLNSDLPEGYETCRQLKAEPAIASTPVIMIAHNGHTQADVVRSFESGASDFLCAKGDPAECLARIQAALRLKQAISQAEALASQITELNNELYDRNMQVEKELYQTRQLQQSLLPPFLPEESQGSALGDDFGEVIQFTKTHFRNENLKISGVYLPCDALGGDLYDVIPFKDGTVGVTVADVSGHGVPAGFVTAIYKASFYRMTHTYDVPGDIMFHLNNELADIVKTGHYVTCLYLKIGLDGKSLSYTGAGHPYPVYYNAREDRIERLNENGTPLVWVKDMDYPTGGLTMAPGDKILLFTDGISEIKNDNNQIFGEEALEQLFRRMIKTQSEAILDGMIQELSNFTDGHPLEDDMSLVLIEVS